MFNAVGIVSEPVERDDHVLVDLECIGVFGNGSGTCAVQPEFLACIGCDGNKAFAVTRIGKPYHRARGLHYSVFVVRHNVANQHHLRPLIAS